MCKFNKSNNSMDKTAKEVMRELRAVGKHQMALRDLECEPLILKDIFPPIPGDPDREQLIQKLRQSGITSRFELSRYSPEGLIEKCHLTEGEVDALAQKLRFLRTLAWNHRRRKARQKDTRRLILRTPYFHDP